MPHSIVRYCIPEIETIYRIDQVSLLVIKKGEADERKCLSSAAFQRRDPIKAGRIRLAEVAGLDLELDIESMGESANSPRQLKLVVQLRG